MLEVWIVPLEYSLWPRLAEACNRAESRPRKHPARWRCNDRQFRFSVEKAAQKEARPIQHDRCWCTL